MVCVCVYVYKNMILCYVHIHTSFLDVLGQSGAAMVLQHCVVLNIAESSNDIGTALSILTLWGLFTKRKSTVHLELQSL